MLYRWQKLDQARLVSFYSTHELKHCASFFLSEWPWKGQRDMVRSNSDVENGSDSGIAARGQPKKNLDLIDTAICGVHDRKENSCVVYPSVNRNRLRQFRKHIRFAIIV